jgi:hypothetical protein
MPLGGQITALALTPVGDLIASRRGVSLQPVGRTW